MIQQLQREVADTSRSQANQDCSRAGGALNVSALPATPTTRVFWYRPLLMAIHAEGTIVPLYRAKRSNPPVLTAFAGTAFFIAPELLVTCWHCVNEDLSSDSGYIALVMQQPWYMDWLYNISRDSNGSDLATANLRGAPAFRFLLADDRALQGVDVSTFGYPFSGLTQYEFGAVPALEIRLFKGYIMRTFTFDYPQFGPTRSYEISFPAPGGLSGAPLVEMFTPRILGVIYGNNDVATTEHFAEVDLEGKRTPEIQRVVSFGLAHHTDTLRNLTGTATKQVPLKEIVKSG